MPPSSITEPRRIGPITFEIGGDHPLARIVGADFEELPSSGKPANLQLRIDHSRKSSPNGSGLRMGTSYFSDDAANIGQVGAFDVVLRRSELGHREATAAPIFSGIRRFGGFLPKFVQRASTGHYATAQEMQAVDFIYHVMLWNLQLALMEQGASFAHASSVADSDGRSVLFAGWGGSGKTSISSYLLLSEPHRWGFLADDMSLVSRDGTLFYNPLKVHLYPYHLRDYPALSARVVPHMSPLSKLNWLGRERILGRKAVVRRMSPRSLYQNVGNQSRLKTAVYIDRKVGDEAALRKMDHQDFSCRARDVLVYESKHMHDALFMAGAIGADNGLLPPFADMMAQVEQTYLKMLEGAEVYHALVPDHWGPVQLAEFFRGRAVV